MAGCSRVGRTRLLQLAGLSTFHRLRNCRSGGAAGDAWGARGNVAGRLAALSLRGGPFAASATGLLERHLHGWLGKLLSCAAGFAATDSSSRARCPRPMPPPCAQSVALAAGAAGQFGEGGPIDRALAAGSVGQPRHTLLEPAGGGDAGPVDSEFLLLGILPARVHQVRGQAFDPGRVNLRGAYVVRAGGRTDLPGEPQGTNRTLVGDGDATGLAATSVRAVFVDTVAAAPAAEPARVPDLRPGAERLRIEYGRHAAGSRPRGWAPKYWPNPNTRNC